MITRVKIADIGVLKDSGTLVTVGLGSCVGVVFYESKSKMAGMAHIMLAESSDFKDNADNPMKYADTALPMMLEMMLTKGAQKSNMVAKIAGGSKLFDLEPARGNPVTGIGERNVQAVKKTLKKMNIPLKGEDVGGKCGRTMKMFVDTGQVEVTSLQGYKKVL